MMSVHRHKGKGNRVAKQPQDIVYVSRRPALKKTYLFLFIADLVS